MLLYMGEKNWGCLVSWKMLQVPKHMQGNFTTEEDDPGKGGDVVTPF